MNSAMNQDWLRSKEHGGVCGADDLIDYEPDLAEIRGDYRWTPVCQRAFLEELACTGSVTRATRQVSKSARSAYALRFRRAGAAFRLGWDAAILIARATLSDLLMDRAVNGYEEVSTRQDDGTVLRGKYDNRLGQGLLNRLDRLAEGQALRGSAQAQVQLVVQDFECFLDLIERGGTGADSALFLSARDDGADAAANAEEQAAIQCELDRISAADADEEPAEEEPDLLDLPPDEAATQLSVWFDDAEQCWKTDFPPADAEAAAQVEESGEFGDSDYARTLTSTEAAAQDAAVAAELAPLRTAALTARAAWFDWQEAA